MQEPWIYIEHIFLSSLKSKKSFSNERSDPYMFLPGYTTT